MVRSFRFTHSPRSEAVWLVHDVSSPLWDPYSNGLRNTQAHSDRPTPLSARFSSSRVNHNPQRRDIQSLPGQPRDFPNAEVVPASPTPKMGDRQVGITHVPLRSLSSFSSWSSLRAEIFLLCTPRLHGGVLNTGMNAAAPGFKVDLQASSPDSRLRHRAAHARYCWQEARASLSCYAIGIPLSKQPHPYRNAGHRSWLFH